MSEDAQPKESIESRSGEASRAGLYRKLAAVMGEMSNLPKDGTNTHFNYKFVTAETVAEAVRARLAAQNVAFFASIVSREPVEIRSVDKKGEISLKTRWVVGFEFTFADGESGATETRPWTAEADAGDDKGINKCATAAEKYFLLKTFIVSTGDEPHADADAPRRGASARTSQRKPPAQQQRPTQPPAASQNGESKPSGASGSNDGDRFARQFPAQPARAATPAALYAETASYFNARAHFDNFVSRHADALVGKTLAEAVAFVQTRHWYFNKERIQQLLDFAEGQYHTTAKDVLEALSNACGRSLSKWRDIDNLTELEAEGALLAWAAGYDLKYVAQRAAEQNDTQDVIAAAERFTNAYNARRQEPA